MLKTQFDWLCKNFGDQSLPIKERWKAIKYVYIENPLIDVQSRISKGNFIYIDNESIGPGFYILSKPNADIEPINSGQIIHFIPLKLVDKISFITDFVNDISVQEEVSELKNESPIIENFDITEDQSLSTIVE